MMILFWILLFLVFYGYAGYPILLTIFARLQRKPVKKNEYIPSVSIILSVYNEEAVIETKIKNFLTLDYPTHKMEIWIGSDGSTDRTNKIIQNFTDPRIHLYKSPARRGKIATLNELARHAKNKILVMTDARQKFAPDAIAQLVGNFSDPSVGCVSGELIFLKEKTPGAIASGVSLYWNYEKFIRRQESAIHSMLGATGAIYAIRRELYPPDVPVNVVLDDMYIPLKIVSAGYRAIFDDTAKAYDRAADTSREEHTRKARTLFGNYQIFFMLPEIFNPFKSPLALQIFSHKFLRVVIPFLLIMIFMLNSVLLEDPLLRIVFILQIIFYIMAIMGSLALHFQYGVLPIISKICYIPYTFCLLNFSALAGFGRFMLSNQEITWKKARENEITTSH